MVRATFFSRLRAWLWTREELYLYLLTPDSMLRTAPPPHPEVTVRLCDAETLPRAQAEIHDFPSLIEKQVRRGDLAIMAVHGEEWVFRSTAVLGPKTHLVDGYPLALTVTDAYLEYAETIPTWRGKGVAPGMLGPTARALKARGITTVYMTININNASSYRAAEKGGATRVGRLRARRFCGRWRATLERFSGVGVTRR